MSAVLKRLDDISETLVRLSTELKQCVEDVRRVSARQLERLEQERTSALLAASVDDQVDPEQVLLHNVEDTESKKVQVDIIIYYLDYSNFCNKFIFSINYF